MSDSENKTLFKNYFQKVDATVDSHQGHCLNKKPTNHEGMTPDASCATQDIRYANNDLHNYQYAFSILKEKQSGLIFRTIGKNKNGSFNVSAKVIFTRDTQSNNVCL